MFGTSVVTLQFNVCLFVLAGFVYSPPEAAIPFLFHRNTLNGNGHSVTVILSVSMLVRGTDSKMHTAV